MVVRLNLVLLLLVVASALLLVRVQYDSRLLYSELDRELRLARQLETESETLQVAVRAQAAAARVEQFARTQLHMRAATPATTRYVHEPVARTQRGDDEALANAQNLQNLQSVRNVAQGEAAQEGDLPQGGRSWLVRSKVVSRGRTPRRAPFRLYGFSSTQSLKNCDRR